MSMFVDGQIIEQTQHTVGGAVDQDPTQNAWIGGNPTGGNFFDGLIDEAILMQRAMTPDEIAALAELTPPDYSVAENGTLSINAASGVLQNDSDVEGDALTVTEVNGVGANVGNQITLSSGALLTLNADGSFDYDPNGQFESLALGQSGTDSFTYTISDGSATDTATVSVTVNGENDTPTLSGISGDSLAYTEGDGAVLIDQLANAAVNDVDATDFDSGYLRVFFNSGSDPAEDILAIRDEGTNPGEIGVSGSDVTYGGVTVGSFTGGSSGATLEISFNSSATAASISALMQNITYENTDTGNPTTGIRTVHFRVNDGDGATSLSHVATVNVGATNDVPTITPISNQSINEDGTTGALAFTVDDAETAAASLIVTASSSNTTIIPNGNLTLVDLGSGNWTIEATPALNQNGGPVTVTVTVDDGTTTTNETFDVTVTAVNDDPTGSGSLTTTSINDNAGATGLFGGLTVADVDTGENDLSLTLTLTDPAAGTITGGGFTETGPGTGIYTFTGLTVAQANRLSTTLSSRPPTTPVRAEPSTPTSALPSTIRAGAVSRRFSQQPPLPSHASTTTRREPVRSRPPASTTTPEPPACSED